MRKNRLRELLKEGKPTLGTHVLIPWPGVTEVVGHSGMFDYVEYVGEYSSFDMHDLDNIGRAIELFPNMTGMMKVEEQTQGFIAQRALDAGIQNLLFTDCRTAEEVARCVQYVRAETPTSKGLHGGNMRRASGYVVEGGSAAWVKAMDEAVIAIMIEKKQAMDNLEEILSVPGVDMVQFGPSDYSISIGKPGSSRLPEVQDAQRQMIKAALAKGIAPRVEIGNFEDAKPFIELGVKHFCIGWDLRMIFDYCKRQGDAMRKLLG